MTTSATASCRSTGAIPWPNCWPPAGQFPLPQHRRITFAYVLLKDLNDAPAQARQLARLLRGFRAKINLIPFNPHPELPFAPPPLERILEFQEILRAANYTVFIRESRGQEIGAACGQLAGEKTGEPTGGYISCSRKSIFRSGE